jgi:hypothetical protein
MRAAINKLHHWNFEESHFMGSETVAAIEGSSVAGTHSLGYRPAKES